MPRVDHTIVLKIECPFCPGKMWNIKHFNNSEKCDRYASCECGGQFRARHNQDLFKTPAQPKETHGTHPVQDPVQTPAQPKETHGTHPVQDPVQTPAQPKETREDEEEEDEWLPF